MIKFCYEDGNECIISEGTKVYMDREMVNTYESYYNKLVEKPETINDLEDIINALS